MQQKLSVFLFYLTSAVLFSIGLTHNFTHCRRSDEDAFKSALNKLLYFTVWNYILQTVYYILCLVNAFRRYFLNKSSRTLDRLCNHVFISLAFPIGVAMVTVFWCIWSIDRELVYPRSLDEIIPTWQNLIRHGLSLPTAFVDIFLVSHKYPSFFFKGISSTALFGLFYMGLTAYMASVHGVWLYPVLEVLNPAQRIILITGVYAFIFGTYKLGHFTHNLVWLHNEPTKDK